MANWNKTNKQLELSQYEIISLSLLQCVPRGEERNLILITHVTGLQKGTIVYKHWWNRTCCIGCQRSEFPLKLVNNKSVQTYLTTFENGQKSLFPIFLKNRFKQVFVGRHLPVYVYCYPRAFVPGFKTDGHLLDKIWNMWIYYYLKIQVTIQRQGGDNLLINELLWSDITVRPVTDAIKLP